MSDGEETRAVSPKRILLLDTGNEWGGGTNSMLELLKRLDKHRFEVTACFYTNYTRGNSTLEHELAAIGVPLLILPTAKQPLWAKIAKELARGFLVWHTSWRKRAVEFIELVWRIRPRARALADLLRKGNYELLYMNNQPASNYEGYLAGEMAGVPVVQHCRSEPEISAEVASVVNRMARSVICVSQGIAEVLIAQGVKSSLCRVVRNAIDGAQALPLAQNLGGIPPDVRVVGTIGSLLKRKSIEQLLRAVAALPDIPPVVVLVVGDGPERAALEQLSINLKIAERVKFAGFQKEPLPWLAAMDIFVLSSISEGLPRVILEAMLLSKPVVASNVVGSRELVIQGKTGYLYQYGDEQALSRCLSALLKNPREAHAMGQCGRAEVLENFTIQRYVTEVSRLLEVVE